MVSKSQLLQGNQTSRIQRKQITRAKEQQARIERQQQQNVQQQQQIQSELDKISQQSKALAQLRESYSMNDDRQGLRDVQAQQKQLTAQSTALRELQSSLSKGYVYGDIGTALSQVKQVGESTYTQEVIRTSRPITQKVNTGTYDPSTQTYINTKGEGFSTTIENVPKGTKIVGGGYVGSVGTDPTGSFSVSSSTQTSSSVPSFLQTKPLKEYLETYKPSQVQQSKELPSILQKPSVKQYLETYTPSEVQKESQRIKDLGYKVNGKELTSKQVKQIATESLRQGGVSFSSSDVNQILNRDKPIEKIKRGVSDIQRVGSNIFFATPKTQKVTEVYSSQLGGYTSASQTGEQGSIFFRTPTTTEKADIERAKKQGAISTYVDVKSAPSKVWGAASNVWTDVSVPTVDFIRKIPTPIKRDEYDIVLTTEDWLGRDTGKIKRDRFLNLGEAIKGTSQTGFKFISSGQEGLTMAVASTGADTLQVLPEQRVQLYQKSTILDQPVGDFGFIKIPEKEVPTFLGSIPGAVGGTAKFAWNITGVPLLASTFESSENIEKINERTSEVINKEYNKYLKDYEKAKSNLDEGEELEPPITKTEFKTRFTPSIRQELLSGNKRNVAFGSALLTAYGLGTFGGTKAALKFKTKVTVSSKGGVRSSIWRPKKQVFTYEERLLGKTNVQGVKDSVFIGKDVVEVDAFGNIVGITKDVKGFGREIVPGKLTIIKDAKGNILYGGSPYGKIGKLERKKTIEYFEKIGIPKDARTSLIKPLRKPVSIRTDLKGSIIYTDKKAIANLELRRTKEARMFNNNIRSAGGTGEFYRIKNVVSSTGEETGVGFSDIQKARISKEGRLFSKLSDKGKTREVQMFNVKLNELGEVQIPKNLQNVDGIAVLKLSDYKLYDVKSASMRIAPTRTRKPTTQFANVFVEQGGKPYRINLEELGFKYVKGLEEGKVTVVKQIMIGGKSKSSKQFLQNMWKDADKKLVQFPAPKAPRTPKSSGGSITKTQGESNLPIMVGGTGLKTITYSGTGQYELNQMEAVKVKGITSPVLNVEFGLPSETYTPSGIKLEVQQISKPLMDTSIKIKPETNIKLGEKTRTETRTGQSVAQVFKQDTLQKLKLSTALKIQLKTPTKLRTEIKTNQVIKPGIKVPKVPVIKTSKTPKVPSLVKSFLKAKTSYEVQVRRRGRFQRVGTGFLPLGKALQLGAKETTSTLAQTFRLVARGKTTEQDIKYNLPKDIFTRPLKPTTKLEFVERRGKTLKKRTGEIPAILKTQTRYFNFDGKKTKGGNIFGI